MVKVSVVVPVYNPGPFIDPGIESMLRQTMPPGDLEVIYVDDGSTDGTPAKLDALAAAHAHIRVIHEPNSGWAGRPRNVGTREARGEYVQFLDQDDAMTPDALRLLYEMAVRNRSDIVIGKVASNFRPVPQHLFRHNVEACTIRDTPLISSLTPHKLFRTAFLREHGIEFPEGRVRLEDQLFMVRAYLVARTVSILADTVCYLYARRDDGGNAGLGKADPVEYFGNLREILSVVVANTEPGPFRTELLSRFYKTGMIDRLSEPWYLNRTEEDRLAVFREIHGLATDFIDDDVHASLGTIRRLRSTLLRSNRQPGLVTIAERLRQLRAVAIVDGLRWAGPRLEVELQAGLVLGQEKRPFEVVRREARALLDPSLTDGVLDEPFEIAEPSPWGRVACSLRERSSGTEWRVPVKVEVVMDRSAAGSSGERVHPAYRAVARVDVTRIAGGHRLGPGSWELQVRVFGPGIDRRTSLTLAPGLEIVPALMTMGDGRIAAAAVAGADGLVVRVPDKAAPRAETDPVTARIEVPIAGSTGDAGRGIEVVGRQESATRRTSGRIERHDGSATLVIPALDAFDTPGPWRLSADLDGTGRSERLVATLVVTEPAGPGSPRPGPASTSLVRRVRRRAWRMARLARRRPSGRQLERFIARWR